MFDAATTCSNKVRNRALDCSFDVMRLEDAVERGVFFFTAWSAGALALRKGLDDFGKFLGPVVTRFIKIAFVRAIVTDIKVVEGA